MFLTPITKSLAPVVKQLHYVLFPVNYSDAYFQQTIESNLCRVGCISADGETAIGTDTAFVGIFTSRLEADKSNQTALYIMTLGVLAPYRDQGIGNALLEHAEQQARNHGCRYMYLHVQEGNDDAITWYERRGFRKTGCIDCYYRKIHPSRAYILTKYL